MRERLAIVNGELFIESRPGAGTIVTARVPLGPRNLSPLLT
jgi:signal transduction histidine kinase